MTRRITDSCQLPRAKKRLVEVDISGGKVTSDGATALLREADSKLGVTERVAAGNI